MKAADRAIDIARLLLAHFIPAGGELVISPAEVEQARKAEVEMVVMPDGAHIRWRPAPENRFQAWKGPLPKNGA